MKNYLKNLEEYQDICVCPFFTSGVRDFLTSKIKMKQHIKQDDYCLYYNTGMNRGKRKLVIMCHTDHPGITLKSDGTGIFWGTPGYGRLRLLLKDVSIPLNIFDDKGKTVGKGVLTEISDPIKQLVKVKVDCHIKNNYYAQYDVENFLVKDDDVYLYNADDGVNVPIMLELINENSQQQLDVYYVFNLHEEVYQLSAWHEALHNTFKLTDKDVIVNLECLRIENVEGMNQPKANYNDGVVLQLSNIGCLFGYKNPGENIAEKLIYLMGNRTGIKTQPGVIKDSCDSRPFTEFKLTPNIVTLTIPNEFKHNNDGHGVVPEKIKLAHISDMRLLLTNLTKITEEDVTLSSKQFVSLSEALKSRDTVTDLKLMKAKRTINERLEVYYKTVIKRGYYFPLTIKDRFDDQLLKWASLAIYVWGKLTKR